jgi:CDP-diacylglycerol--glycerol-3-phosphate 3-phosphatidyltransferase
MKNFKKQLPNILTYSRIAAVPLLAAVFMNPCRAWLGDDDSNRIAALIFLYAGTTDLLDGYLARAWEANTSLGKFLDPIADKLLVATCLMLLVANNRAAMVPALAILCREILVSGLREFLAELRIGVPVSKLAQYKTAIQMIAMYLLLIWDTGPWWLSPTISGPVLLWIAAALTLVTGYAYLRTARKYLSSDTPK